MANIRKNIIIFVIGILFVLLVNLTIEAVYPMPSYEDYCTRDPVPNLMPKNCSYEASPELYESCDGVVRYEYESGCPVSAYCDTCYQDLDTARENYNLIVFVISSIGGLGALIAGLNLPKNNPINEWVGSGFLLGGLLTIGTGTIRYFGDMGRYMRPIVIFIELVLVIYLTYKKLGKK